MQEHLQNLENYIQGNDLDVLIQSAIFHAQFELIHPFLDGNGRSPAVFKFPELLEITEN